MHATSRENMLQCYRRYISGTELEAKGAAVLDVGASDVNGSYRGLFARPHTYLAADLQAAPGVDIVLADPYVLPVPNASMDIVISGQAFEHIEFFWRTFAEMVRALKPDGFIFLIAPSSGPQHRYPVDCYRFYPDAYAALARHGGCELVETWTDERGPWRDLVGVFRRPNAAPMKRLEQPSASFQIWQGTGASPGEEVVRGKSAYLDVLARLQKALSPQRYIEIGVRHGGSLALAQCPALGIDPAPEITVELPPTTQIIAKPSDEYFRTRRKDEPPVDFAFIDGLHLFEQALRDFMHVEQIAVPGSCLVIDDVSPNHPAQAARDRRTNVWTGDVWKLHEVLKSYRPDLRLTLLDTSPSGLLLVSGLDPANRILWHSYNPIVRQFIGDSDPPRHVLERHGAVPDGGDTLEAVIAGLRSEPPQPSTSGGSPRVITKRPALSVVVVGFDMARELPRTIASLSHTMQRDIDPEEYELILLDNGSKTSVDAEVLCRIAPNLRVERIGAPTVSPVPAINRGLELARGDLVGVCIDGARMASPGLLAAALAASRLHDRPVIGTIAFHLGHEVQMTSVAKGYNQIVEDALLASTDWREDGYRLFDISVFAGSSEKGWFALPAETNALFLRAEHWRALGGYDPAFVLPGGGLANLDMWKRACDDPSGMVVMLLGEATFHQMHGGIATNNPPDAPTQTAFREEYERLRGQPHQWPAATPRFFGSLRPALAQSLAESIAYLGKTAR